MGLRPLTFGLALALGATLAAAPIAAAQSGNEIMQKHRQLHRLHDEEERLVLRLVSKTGATKERTIVRYSLTGGDGLGKMLVRFVAPRDVENTSLLSWEARDGNDDQWLYLPAIKKVRRVAASGKKNRFMGTDFTYEDLRPENVAANRYALQGAETLDGHECFVIEAVAATEKLAADSAYGKRRLWVRRDSLAIVKREYYDRSGRLEKVETFANLAVVKDQAWRAGASEMRDVLNGSRTLVVVERRAVDRGLRDDFFTEVELARGGS